MTSRSRAARRRRLPLRYLLPSLFLVALSAMLMLRGYVHSEILADHRVQPPAATDQVPEEIIEGGPVIAQRDGEPATFSVPDHKLVLTFDDGPDPEWTPKVLDVLAEHDAHGVFFVTGTMASRHPDLVKRMVDEGHELGLHTFNHPDLSFQSRSRIDWELTQNQLALAGCRRSADLAVPAAVLLVLQRHGQQVLAGHRVHRLARLPHRRQQHRQRGLEAPRRRRDHPPRHPARR